MSLGAEPWLADWINGPHFHRFAEDLLLHTIARLRPGAQVGRDVDLGEGGLDLDSLERFNLAVAMAEALQQPGIGDLEHLATCSRIADWITAARTGTSRSTAVGFRTSGTSGAPGFVSHPLTLLGEDARALADLFGARKRILSAVPAHHIYGFLHTVLLPEVLDAAVVDVRHLPAPDVAAIAQRGDLVIGFPQFWQALTIARWSADVAGASAGGALAPGVHGGLLERGICRLVDVFGSSETASIGWRDRPGDPYRLFAFWERAGDEALARTVDGKCARFAVPDVFDWQGPASFLPVARRDGVVQIGGVNVDPAAVRAALLAHPGVAVAAVRPMRPEEGDRLKAFVVPHNPDADRDALRQDLDRWLAGRLPPLARPRAVTFGDTLPLTGLGKPADWSVPAA